MRCRFCGYEGSLSDFEEDHIHHAGVWCPDCDSFNLFDEAEEKARVYALYLEDVRTGSILKCRKKIPQYVSPLRYPGGKTKLIPYVAVILPETVTRFVEPFAGGASVGLALLSAGLVKEVVLNDIDNNVAALFRQIISNPEALSEKIMAATPDRDIYFRYRESLLNHSVLDDGERAFRFLYCNRLAFSGILFANPMGNMEKRWNPKTLCKRIRHIYSLRDGITITQEDAMAVIEEEYWRGSNTFLFIDPPYFKQGKRLYRKAYESGDHADLAWLTESLYRELPGSHIMITYDNAEEIKKLYDIADVYIIKPAYCLTRGSSAST